MDTQQADSPLPASDPASGAPELADLGVLFVHGIGDQAQCETLLQFGEPLVEWMREWQRGEARRDARAAAAAVQACLKAPLLKDGVPAHASVVIGTAHGDEVHTQTWLMAEAWWGGQALAPPIGEFTAWLLTRGPWTLLLHFNQWWMPPSLAPDLPRPSFAARLRRRAVELLRGVPITALWCVLSLLTSMLLLACSLVAIVPIGKLRAAVHAVLRALTGIVGDAYLLMRSPIRSSAFETATLQSLQWLRSRCRHLAVVAHSQGAVIAHAVLQRDDAPRAQALVTVGAGIAKLHALAYFERCSVVHRVAPLLASPLTLLAALAWIRVPTLGAVGQVEGQFGPGMLSLAAAVMLGSVWVSVRGALAQMRLQSAHLALTHRHPGLRWCDIVATHDPVPAGNLTRFFEPAVIGVDAVRVTVLRSWLSDHTNYWRSRASFLPLLARELDRCAHGAGPGPAQADSRVATAAMLRHQTDVRVLKVAQWLESLAILLPLLLAGDRLVAAVERARDWLAPAQLGKGKSAPLAFVDGGLTAAENAVAWVAFTVSGTSSANAGPIVALAAALLTMVFALVVWRKLAHGLWQAWSSARNAEVRYGAPERPAAVATASGMARLEAWGRAAPDKVMPLCRDALMGLLLAAPLLLSGLWTFDPPTINERNAWALPGWLSVTLLVAIGLASGMSDAAEKMATARAWLRSHPIRGRPDWPTFMTMARQAWPVAFGLGMATMVIGNWLGVKASAEVGIGLIGASFWFGVFMALLDGIWHRLRPAGVGPGWRRLWLALPAAAGIAAGLGLAAGPGAPPTPQSLAGGAAIGTFVVGGLEWGVLWWLLRRRTNACRPDA